VKIENLRSKEDRELFLNYLRNKVPMEIWNTIKNILDNFKGYPDDIDKINELLSLHFLKSNKPIYEYLEAIKKDEGKLQWSLIPLKAMTEVAKVYQMGAEKYAPGNWKRGLRYSRIYNAMMRHLIAWKEGEDNDPESHLNHLAHVAWGCLALIYYSLKSPEYEKLDDREGD